MNFTTTSFGARFALSLSIFLILTASLIGQTTPQLTLLKDIQVGAASSNPENLTSLTNKVVFTADDGINGKELWASDGTEAGTMLIKDFVVGSGSPVFSSFVELGGYAYFVVNYNETPKRIELWKTDGTQTNTTKLFNFADAYPTTFFVTGNPFTANNIVYIPFTQNETVSQLVSNSLWVSDGTSIGTHSLTTVTSSFQNTIVPTYYYEKGQPIFAVSASNSCSDPLATGYITVIDSLGVKPNVPFGSSTSPGACYTKTLGVMGRNLYFLQANTVSPTPSTKVSLFKVSTDGVKTVVIDSFSTYSRMTNALSGIRSVASNNWLYFFYEMQMWKSDGTTLGTVPLTTRQFDTEPTDLMTSLVDGDAVYFTDNFSRFRYWRSSNGTKPVLISSESSPLLFVSLLKKVGNKIYSFGSDPTDVPNPLLEIKSSDGQIPFIKIAESRQIRFIPSIGAIPNFLFFGFNDATKGLELGAINLNAPVIAPCDTDRIAPVISSCPQNINLTTTGTTAVASWTTPTATDNCTAVPSVSSNYTSGSPFGIGTTTVTYTATDAKNNTATCRFNVTVGFVNNSCRQSDSLQLVSLYNATNGAGWINKWNLNAPMNTWYGVTLNLDGCVQKIVLQSNNLRGSLPNLNIPNIVELWLNVNQLTGTIPNFNLPNCQLLYLQSNQLTGTIPNFNLPNLRLLYLNNNQLTGAIPNFNLPNLLQLSLANNQTVGTIPSFNLPNLNELYLNDNQLSGTVPNFNLPNLSWLYLNNNQLNAITPNFTLPNLNNLLLDHNKLSGSIPEFNLPNIRILYLNNNLFSGCIPASFKFFCGKIVDISNNPDLATLDLNAFCNNNIGSCNPTVVANCASHSNAPWSEWIAQVQLNTLNNVSEKTRADRYVVGYSDWKDKTTTLSRSQTYPLSITPGLSWAAYQTNLFFRAWIDYNSNGIYEDTELVLEKNSVSSTVNQSVTIPATAVLGTTTMRVSMKKDAYPTACETFAAGEVEDYSVVIQTGTTGGCTPSVPTKLYAKDITATTAKLVWAKVNNAVDYEYQLLYDDTSQPNGGALISSAIVSDTFANITIPQGRLRAFVRSRCAATWSAWSNATMFNQLTDVCSQSALTAFVQDFENVTIATSTSYNLPNCWSKLTYHAPSVIEAWTDVRLTSRGTVGNNTKRAILFHSTPLADSALIMLVSPEISNLAAGTNRLRFKAANTFGVDAAGNAVIQIGTLSNPFDASSFTPFGSQTVINGQVFAEYIVDFAAYHGSDRYLVFKYISSGGDFYRSLEIDDVAWEVRPSNPCLNDVTPPVLVNCPANISVTTTGTTALATWATVTATDNCTTPPSVSSTFLSGQGFPIGTTTVVYTARDAANNTTTCAFSVVVTASTVTANCVSKSNAPWSEWIANVQFNTINNTSSKTRDDRFVVGYSDWKDISTTVTRGQTALLTITPGLSWPGYQTPLYFHAWIDYNRNGIYEASELVLEKFNTSFAVNQSVTIPTTASIGTTTMRVSMKKGAYSSACESFDLGEVEDYTVVIQDGNPTPCANNVLNFDGNDDYLQTPQAVIPANTDFTMEASFTSTASNFGCNGNFKRLLSLELSASVNRFEIGDCAGQLTLFYFISGGATNLINIPNVTNLRDGNWHHVAAVKKGDVVSIYYDGVLVLTQAGLTNINNVPRILYVGRWGISGENWQGNVDEVRVWNYAVSATDILNRRNCQLLGNESGLVLYFPFNQGVSAGSNTTITTVIDKSPSNMTTPMSFFGMQGSVSNFVCSTQTLTQGCTSTDPCANDITPPVFQNCPQNINLTALTGSTTATATWTAPTATDNCSPPSVSSNYTGGGTFFIGTTAVVYTAKDVRNNTGTCSFNVVVSAPANTCRYNDSLVLVDFNIKTNGANWTTKWDFTQPINTWFGVYLNSNGCVGSLALQNNNLVGTIPLGLVNLSKLTELSLNGNKLTGTIPSSFGTLTGLTFLDLGNNQLIGTIPPSLTNLTQLGVFNLQNNQLTGTIPPNLGSMSNLLLVSFNDNQLIGSIPNSLGSLTKLRKLYLFNNQLSDTIPSNLGNITTLEELILYNNKLTGTIPTSLGNTSALAFLYLDNNLLSGCLPLSLKNLCNKFVRISGNVNLPNGGDWTAFCNTSAGACPPTTGGTNDLEVSVIANAATFKKWTNTGFKINLKNIGNQTFTNIELTFPYPTGTVNGGTPTPSVGTFQQYCAGGTLCYKWTIPSLAAGVTATLDVPLFVLDVTTIIGTAQLLTSTPTDANAANNTTTATMTLQTIVPSLTFKPTQLIPVVIQTLSPNPTDGELSLKLESLDTREVSFEFYNALGKAVKSEKRVVEKGLNRVDFSLFDLEQGVYFIVPSTGQGRKVPTKFVKL